MAYKVITLPVTEIISMERLKAHCFATVVDESLLTLYLAAACERFTEGTGIVINATTLEYSADDFDDVVKIYRTPFIELLSIKYYDTAGTIQDLAVTDVYVDETTRPARITPKSGKWPLTDKRPGGVRIQFKAGHATADKLNRMIEWALLTMTGTSFEFREDAVSGTIITKVPTSAQTVIDMFSNTEVL